MCTTGVVFSDKATYVFKNRDLTETVKMGLPEIRAGKNRYIAFFRPAGGIWFGVNEKGIALTASDAHTIRKYPEQKEVGNKIACIYESIVANASTIEEAEKIMVDSFRKNIKVPDMLIISDSKTAVAYEYTPKKEAMQRETEGALLRTNSFKVLPGAPDENKDPSSHLRFRREKELIRGVCSSEQIKKLLRDHENGPGENSICRHGIKKGEYTTQYSVIAEIKDTVIDVYYVANNMPCREEYKKITLKRSV